jgi:hypothetical protein
MGALNSQPQVIKFTSYLLIVDSSLWVLRLLPPLKLVAMIVLRVALNWYLLLLHAALRRKSKDWLARNQNNMSEWKTCLPADCCFSELALKIQLGFCLVQSGPHHQFWQDRLFHRTKWWENYQCSRLWCFIILLIIISVKR